MSGDLKKLEERWPIGLLGLVLSVLLAIAGIYFTEYYQKQKEIKYTVLSVGNIVDLKQRLTGLAVFFQGEDITAKGLDLQALQLRVENVGRTDLIQGYFDKDDDWGLAIQNASIVTATLVSASSEYVSDKINLKIRGDKIVFEKIIFEGGQSFVFDLLLLKRAGENVTLKPIGKIAGFSISTEKSTTGTDDEGLISQAVKGGFWVNVIRFVGSVGVFIVSIVIVVFTMIGISEYQDSLALKKRRANFVTLSSIKHDGVPDELAKRILDLYVEKGPLHLAVVNKRVKSFLDTQNGIREDVKKQAKQTDFDVRLNWDRDIQSFWDKMRTQIPWNSDQRPEYLKAISAYIETVLARVK